MLCTKDFVPNRLYLSAMGTAQTNANQMTLWPASNHNCAGKLVQFAQSFPLDFTLGSVRLFEVRVEVFWLVLPAWLNAWPIHVTQPNLDAGFLQPTYGLHSM